MAGCSPELGVPRISALPLGCIAETGELAARRLPADYESERDRVLSPAEIRKLADIFQRMDGDYANAPHKRKADRPVDPKRRVALWLCLSTLCRIGELLMVRWEHVDLDKEVWFTCHQAV